jgi:signal transduction histidine kinase
MDLVAVNARAHRHQKDAELARLEERVAVLEHRNEELHHFSAAVAHELREPLIAIEGYATLLSERLADELDPPVRHDLDALLRGTERMRMVVETLLQQARSGLQLRHEPVDLAALAEDCIAMLAREIAACRARVDVGSLPVVDGDGRLLASVFQNLLSNALRYGSRDGGVIAMSASREGDGWRIVVDNEGMPIAADDRLRIFNPFRRGEGERRADGIGLGLAICRAVVEQHGGTIGVEPLENGNRFFFTLPA